MRSISRTCFGYDRATMCARSSSSSPPSPAFSLSDATSSSRSASHPGSISSDPVAVGVAACTLAAAAGAEIEGDDEEDFGFPPKPDRRRSSNDAYDRCEGTGHGSVRAPRRCGRRRRSHPIHEPPPPYEGAGMEAGMEAANPLLMVVAAAAAAAAAAAEAGAFIDAVFAAITVAVLLFGTVEFPHQRYIITFVIIIKYFISFHFN